MQFLKQSISGCEIILLSSAKRIGLDRVLMVGADHRYIQDKAEDQVLNLEEPHAL
jgi:hypothetical protein